MHRVLKVAMTWTTVMGLACWPEKFCALLEKNKVDWLCFSPEPVGRFHADLVWRRGMRRYAEELAGRNRDTMVVIHEMDTCMYKIPFADHARD